MHRETRLFEVSPGDNVVRRNPASGNSREDPGTLQEKETVSDWVGRTKRGGDGGPRE